MDPLRSLILAAAGNDTVQRLVATNPASRRIVERFVAGETVADAVAAVRDLAADGCCATLDYLGEDTTDRALADQTVDVYLHLLAELAAAGLAHRAEVSVKLSAVSVRGGNGDLDEELALRNVGRIAEAAQRHGTTVTVDMEDHATTDATLRVLAKLRREWPSVGAVLQSYLRRAEADAAEFARPGSRVRLCKGAYAEPPDVAVRGHEVDVAYLRCANVLLEGGGYPMFATHDPRLIRVLAERTRWYGREKGSYEYQMLYGVRPDEQRRLATEGETVRVYVPFGEQWYGYLMRRLAERPANVAFFLRALAGRS